MNLFPHESETILGAARDLRAGRRTSLDLVEQCLARIDALEPDLRAWVSVDRDDAVREARRVDAEKTWRGPLYGVPIGIKDIVDVAGRPTRAGSSLTDEAPVARDAELVRRLRAAGAIVLGKTVTTEFASFDPPPTLNPWNRDRTPGGSSSGSAAAVGAGMCFGAIGSQTGGSITRPASFCGVAGCKPTYGRVSVRGVLPLAVSMDHPGPITRTVRDAAVMMNAICGPDPDDAFSASELWIPIDFDADGSVDPIRTPSPPRLGVLRGMFDEMLEDAAREPTSQAYAVLRKAGADLQDVALPDRFADVLPRHRTIMAVEAAAVHEALFKEHRDEFGPAIRSLVEEGLASSATEYARCRAHQRRLTHEIRECFNEVDALLCPAATGPAPDPSTTGNPAFNSPWSYTGLPSVSFPVGLTADGMPVAVQLIGRPFDEAALFRAAAWCEDAIVASMSK